MQLRISSLIPVLCACLMASALAYSPNPNLTAAGAIATLKTDPNSSPVYGETYNLGATGLRGWIYIDRNNRGEDGTMTGESRQILVTVASTPGSAVLAADDVILGAMAGSSGTVPAFTGDCRKAFGAAITDAEKTGAGTLRVKRWRAGTTTHENIPMTIMGDYTATAPFSCPKSSLILANARNKLVGQLLADANFLTKDWKGAISGLALLAGVQPGDPDYDTVQTRLQTFARSCASTTPPAEGGSTWHLGYICLFLAEYYLLTNDTQVVSGLNDYTVTLARMQSRYGTFGHSGSLRKADGSLHGTIPPYGPVNSAGVPANVAIVLGKKALLAAGQQIDPEIDPAIQRGSDFFGWFVNKGVIPYGEHEPGYTGHSSNGRNPGCALLFSLQEGRTAETEFFARTTLSSYKGREYGHTGQGFSYLWSAMGANAGGAAAATEHLKPVRWHLDLTRRTDGSFAYDGGEQYGGGSTSDGTYLGASGYYGMNPAACYILTYALPLQRIYLTGKNANPANTLDAAKVAHAVAAANIKFDVPAYTTDQLFTSLSDYDPVVRHYAAVELGTRTLNSTELTTLRGMVGGTNANGRMGACQALGLLNDATALPLITQRLDKNIETHSWVRAKAASAIRSYPSATASTHRDTMLAAYTANATDPEVIVWDDPIQISNNFLSFALFGGGDGNNISSYTVNAPKNLLYPAVKAGLKQPDAYSRSGASRFCYDRLTLPDVQALALDIFEVITTKSQADTMFSITPQLNGIALLKKHNCAEGLPMALSMMDVQEGWGHGAAGYLSQVLDNLATWGDSARWIIPFLKEDISTLQPVLNPVDYNPTVPKIHSTIATIENATTSPGGIIHLMPLATPQVVATTGAKAITLTGTSPRGGVSFTNVTAPAHGTLIGTAPDLTYTPNAGYSGPDHFTFQVLDSLTTSEPGTVSIIVGTAGTGLTGEYFDNLDFTNLKHTRTDAQVNFDWGTGSPHASVGADTFSVRWSGLLLVPETGTYTFSTLNSDGVRLYLNGQLVIDDYVDQTTNWKDGIPVNLTAGQMVDLHLRYYEKTGSAVAKLKWTGPSFAGVNGAIIGTEWLYDGTGMNLTPYAHAQSVRLVGIAPKPITLTGSGGTLTYVMVTPPAHGTLTGTAPNLTYHPGPGYNGTDSFTFLVNNGTSDSSPATVSLADGQLINVNFTGGTAGTESALSGPAGGLGTSWNQFMGPDSPGTLVDSSGAPTTVTIDTNFGLPGTFDSPVLALPMLRGSMTNFDKGNDGTNVTISGLEAGGFYDIWLVTLRNQPFYSDGTEQYVGWWSTTNDTTSPGNQLVNAVGTTTNTSTFVDGYNYVLFANVEANAGGNIVFTGVAGDQLNGSDNNHRLGLNGLQIKRTDATSTVESSPATVFADGVLTSTVTVTLRDANGNGVSGKVVTLANTSGPQAATINPQTAITTNAAGQAVFNMSSTTPGIEIFTATNVTDALTLTDTASVEFVEVGVLTDAAQSTVVASPVARLADGLSTSIITVTLRDAYGYPVSGKDVALANTGGPQQATISPAGAVTSNASGQAVFSVRSGTIGAEEFTATDTTGSIGVAQIATVSFIDPNAPKLINVNIDNTVQPGLVGPVGGLGVVWNTIAAPSATNLLLASGPASTVGFTSSGTGGWGGIFENNTEPTLRLLKRGIVNFNANSPNTQQLVITGLDPAKTYDLYIASAILITSNQASRGEWSTSNTTSTPGSQAVDNTLDENGSTWVRGNNYVLFEDVVPDGSGNITVDGFAITGAPYDIRLPLNGFQLVESAPVTGGFSTWASANGATGQTPQQDHDNDGVKNGIEYFMGETGSSFTAMPGLDATNTVTWPMDPTYQGTYEVQTSPDLGTWTNVVPKPTPSGGTLSYTLPVDEPGGKSFLRLLVTPTP